MGEYGVLVAGVVDEHQRSGDSNRPKRSLGNRLERSSGKNISSPITNDIPYVVVMILWCDSVFAKLHLRITFCRHDIRSPFADMISGMVEALRILLKC